MNTNSQNQVICDFRHFATIMCNSLPEKSLTHKVEGVPFIWEMQQRVKQIKAVPHQVYDKEGEST